MPADYYATPPAPADRKGCPKWVPIGCGVGGCLVLILLFVGGAFLTSKGAGAFTTWFLGQMESDVDKKIAPDVQPQQRRAFHDSFAALRAATGSGKAGLTQMPELLQSYRDAIGDQKVDDAELTELTNAARSAATPKRER